MIYRTDYGKFITSRFNWGESIYNYLNQFITGLTYDSETNTVDFWGKFKIRITEFQGVHTLYFTPTNGIELGLGSCSDVAWSANWYATLVKTDNFFFFSMKHEYNNPPTFNIFWAKDKNDIEYAGGIFVGNAKFYNSQIYKLDGSTISTSPAYYPVKFLDFTAPSFKLAFSDIAIAATSGNQSFIIPDLCSCSTVTKGDNLTIQGDNYAAIDTNTLVKLDPVT